jgi:hypothetical protein
MKINQLFGHFLQRLSASFFPLPQQEVFFFFAMIYPPLKDARRCCGGKCSPGQPISVYRLVVQQLVMQNRSSVHRTMPISENVDAEQPAEVRKRDAISTR